MRLRDRRASSTSIDARSSSPVSTGAGHAISSPPGDPNDVARASTLSAQARIHSDAVSQPDAASPPKIDAAAA